MADNSSVLIAVGIGGPLIGAAVAMLTARINSRPPADLAATAKFKALTERQEKEREELIQDYDMREARLERIATELEVMVIRLNAWADESEITASRNNLKLPERPKFSHLGVP